MAALGRRPPFQAQRLRQHLPAVDLSAPGPAPSHTLSGAPDTTAVQQAGVAATQKQTEEVRKVVELKNQILSVDQDIAAQALLQAAEGPKLLQQELDRAAVLTAELGAADEMGALIARQGAEYQILERSTTAIRDRVAELLGKKEIEVDFAKEVNAALDRRLEQQTKINELQRASLEYQEKMAIAQQAIDLGNSIQNFNAGGAAGYAPGSGAASMYEKDAGRNR